MTLVYTNISSHRLHLFSALFQQQRIINCNKNKRYPILFPQKNKNLLINKAQKAN